MNSTIAPSPHNVAPLHGDAAPFRRQPMNIPAEKSLLGAIFVNNRAYEKVSDFLRPEHFALAEHGQVYDAIVQLIDRGTVADPVTLKSFFEANQSLGDIGGPAYLMELANSAVTVINAGEYGRIVRDLAIKRELIGLGSAIVGRAYGGNLQETAETQIDLANATLDALLAGGRTSEIAPLGDVLRTTWTAIEEAHKAGGKLVGLSTGLADVDNLLGGLVAGDLMVVAGSTSMGKTSLATGIAMTTARAGGTVAMFSLEMSQIQNGTRLLSQATGISTRDLRRGAIGAPQFEQVVKEGQNLSTLPVYLDCSSGIPMSVIRGRCRRLRRSKGLALVIIDYLQQVASERRYDSRVRELDETIEAVKMMAKELEVPVIVLSQLSRTIDAREDKRPRMSDLRDSGRIEQEADIVALIYRPEYYLERNTPEQRDGEDDKKFGARVSLHERRLSETENRAELIVAKNRQGTPGTCVLHFDKTRVCFRNADHGLRTPRANDIDQREML